MVLDLNGGLLWGAIPQSLDGVPKKNRKANDQEARCRHYLRVLGMLVNIMYPLKMLLLQPIIIWF